MKPMTEDEWAQLRRDSVAVMPEVIDGLPDVLLDYQQELLSSTAKYALTVTDKSRRIGATWGIGADAVLTSGAKRSAGGMDTLYLGYNLDMAREFIDTCAMWARSFNQICSSVQEFLFTEEGEKGEDRSIAAFRITFASGFEITALSSKPRSLRGRQGYVILDEFAFHDDAAELLKAAMALLIWGGKVLVISTHNGVDNPFNQLIQEIREGRRPGNVVRCTFDDALQQGLYKRICLIRGKEWSPEAEAEFRSEIRAFYADGAAEELDCIPAQGSGVYLSSAQITAVMDPDTPVVRLKCPEGFELRSDEERRAIVEDWLIQEVDPLLAKLDRRERHNYGFDFGRSGDLSVLVPLAEKRDLTRRAPFVVELRNVPFRQQEQILFHICDQLPRLGAGRHDARGNGQFLAEYAVQRYGALAIEAVMLTQGWYLEHMPPMKAAIEDRALFFPLDVDLKGDLRQIQMVRGIPMVPNDARTKGADGGQRHGDFAVALCLANQAAAADIIEYGYTPATADDPSSFLSGGDTYVGRVLP
ncbi:terminase large subunit domain-containing protein [Notoacmeibacter ruber]|uniref:terminase large subunit domain-containing protein n=1 Tax=Notoacmeibacter ruber TaxID=2670375 RepID=UPI0018F64FBF|nr:terminase family protein [Notoacmeibacter ruber]